MKGNLILEEGKIECMPLYAGMLNSPRLLHPIQFEVSISKDVKKLLVKLGDFPFVEFHPGEVPEAALDAIARDLGERSLRVTMMKLKADKEKAVEEARLNRLEKVLDEEIAEVSGPKQDEGGE